MEQPFGRGDRWSILPVMNQDGYLAVCFIKGSVDGGNFLDFLFVMTWVAGAQQGCWGASVDSDPLSTEKEQRVMNTI